MRATTRLTGGISVLALGLAAAACGHSTADGSTTPADRATHASATPPASPAASPPLSPKPAECRTRSLRWTLVLLPAKSSGPRDARLTAANNGPEACVFSGYPAVLVHNGKANSLQGVGHGHPKAVTLRKGAKVTVDLRYTPSDEKGAGGYCVRDSEALVSAPHNPDSDRTDVPVMDAHHHAAQIDACGGSISMSPPRYTPP
ncbi:DUF4232 domain-containing protein [Streptomyces sp. NPDC047022]|uniref:DUF4232 domain-containing protein n=1 Tax=Streptomyces sp. NPDC047022 TaxID=3155737 RepID=UPI0033F66BB2